MAIVVTSYNAKANEVTFTAPGHTKPLRIKNRAAIAKVTAAQVLSNCSAAQIHEQLLNELMPDIQKKLASGNKPAQILSYLHSPVLVDKMFFAAGAEGKFGAKARDCACNPCMDSRYPECEMCELTVSTHKAHTFDRRIGWAETQMYLKQETGIAAGGKKPKRGESDAGWKIKEQQVMAALEPGKLVAIYCGSDADTSGIPYWLAHVKAAEGGAAKYRVKKTFSQCGVSFKKNSYAIDLTQLDFKTTDRQGRQQYTRTDTISSIKPKNLLPVLVSECDSSTNYLYISERAHNELLEACKWVM